MNLKELTEMLNVDKSTTTKAVQKLERAGYVIKSHLPDNRKSIALYPTEKAKIVYEKVIHLGLSPWAAFHQGISRCLGITFMKG